MVGEQARVYHFTGQMAQTSNATFTSTLSIFGSSAYVLFDSGESHSFIMPYLLSMLVSGATIS